MAIGEGACPDVGVFLKARVVHHPLHFYAVGPESFPAGQRQVAKLIISAAAGGTGGCRHQVFEAVEQRGDVHGWRETLEPLDEGESGWGDAAHGIVKGKGF